MKISHESPISMLEESRVYNDYDYALVHLFETEPMYYDFFKKSLALGRHVILDNSIFELGKAFDSERFAHYINELRPTEYIIPDVLEDSPGTIESCQSFLDKHPNLPGKKIGVVQGKTLDELISCYQYLDEVAKVDKIAISFDYSYYLSVAPHPNKWMSFAMGRVATLGELLELNIINKQKPHHLLGCSVPIEFMFYRGWDWIESLDTSSPIVHGLLGIEYEPVGLLTKQSIKLVDLIGAVPNVTQRRAILRNLNYFKNIVRGIV